MESLVSGSAHFFQETDFEYVIGTNPEAQINVFFPVDCKNNCAFCTTKKLYVGTPDRGEKYVQSRILHWKKMFANVCKSNLHTIIFTGGEICYDLSLLDSSLAMCEEYKKTVYLNTELPEDINILNVATICNKYSCIQGINVSRHILDRIFNEKLFKAPIRINVLVTPSCQCQDYINFWKDHNIELSFREDYSKITKDNLYDTNAPVLLWLTKYAKLVSMTYCHYCSNYSFITKEGLKVRYHRGLPYTSGKIGCLTEHMELVMTPTGVITTDWDFRTDGLAELAATYNLSLK